MTTSGPAAASSVTISAFAAVSVITNLAAGLSGEPLSHTQTLAEAERAGADLIRLLVRFLERLP